MPLFSILIPTRNRAALLKQAVESVLAQDFGDFEIIINDNASTDNTREAAAAFTDPRVKYFRMPEFVVTHTNWNTCYDRAGGEFFVVLGDDDYLLPGALARVAAIIARHDAKLVSYGIVTYYDQTYHEARLKNTVQVRTFSGKVLEHSSETVINDYFGFNSGTGYPPHPSATVINKKLADGLRAKCGMFYVPPLGEIMAVPWLIRRAGAMYVADKPLAVVGRGSSSQVAQEMHDPRTMWENLAVEFDHTFFKGKYLNNALAESLLKLKDIDPENFAGRELDFGKYCEFYYENMLEVARGGINIDNDLVEFRAKLSGLPPPVRRRLKARLFKLRCKAAAKQFLVGSGLSEFVRRHITLGSTKRINCRELGISDIRGCAENMALIAGLLGEPPAAWDSRAACENE